MEGPGATVRLEDLLAHRAWVRRVARALVLDESRADDLEQETWLRVLQGPAPRHPRAWLGTLLRNAASNLRRGEQRRAFHEAWSLPAPPLPSPDELLERAEVVERVARAVRTLEEPSRTAILLRYFEDLSPPAIAARLGVPLETVRARLRRGLLRLRERLDEDHLGDRRKWCLLLLPLSRRPEPAAAGPALAAGITGAILMTAKAKAAITAAVVLLAVGALWWARSGSPGKSGVRTGPSSAVSPAVHSPSASAKSPAPGPSPALRPIPAPAPGPLLVLDPDGKPVAGATVESLRLAPFGPDTVTPVPVPVGRTDGAGRARWPEGKFAFPCVVRAIHAEHAPGEAVAVSRDAEVVVRLRRGCLLEGRVETGDGTPVEGASVTALALPLSHVLGPHLGVTGTWSREAKSGADGRFRISGLPPAGAGLLTARAEGYMETRVAWRPLAPDPVRLVLERPFRSVVRVRDRAGNPLDGASVWAFQGARLRMGRWLMPDPDVLPLPPAGPGTYAREDLPAGWYSLLVACRGYRLVVEEYAAFGRNIGPVEVVLEETTGLRGRVVWYDTKAPVAGVRVRATPLRKVPPTAVQEDADSWYWPVSEMDGPFVAVTGEDGTYELPVFGPSDRLKVEARGEEGARGWIDHPPYPRTESAELGDIWLHRLLREVDYTGRIVSAAGEPIPGAIVEGNADVVTAGPDGRFRLVSRQAGSSLQFLAPGFAPRTVFAPGTTPTGGGDGRQEFGDVALAPLREIRGSVVDAGGNPVPGLALWAEPVDRASLRSLSRDLEFTGAAGASDAEGKATLLIVPGYRYAIRPFDGPGRLRHPLI